MDLSEFLLARIAEDERLAPDLDLSWWIDTADDCGDAIRHFINDSDRMLAECEAKRRIIAEHAPNDCGDGYKTCVICADHLLRGLPWPCPTLRALALPYADHPDFDKAWAPVGVG